MHYDARTLVIHQTFTSDNSPKGMPLPSAWVTALNLGVVMARDLGKKTLLLRAYPKSSAARKVIQAHAKCSKAK
jgi:hypothetical protein